MRKGLKTVGNIASDLRVDAREGSLQINTLYYFK